MSTSPDRPEVFPPGEFIKEELEARGWTQRDLAWIVGRPQPNLNLIITNKAGITAAWALRLAAAFGTTPEFWFILDNAYRLSKESVPIDEIRQRARQIRSQVAALTAQPEDA